MFKRIILPFVVVAGLLAGVLLRPPQGVQAGYSFQPRAAYFNEDPKGFQQRSLLPPLGSGIGSGNSKRRLAPDRRQTPTFEPVRG